MTGSSSPEVVELQALAAYEAGDLEGCIAAWEDLYASSLAVGDREQAARAAVTTAMFLLMDTGLMAPVRGWVRRAEQLLAEGRPGPVHALTAAVRGYERLFSGDQVAARAGAEAAVALGALHGNAQANVMGCTALARLALLEGDLAEGLAALDEVGARLMAGELDAVTTGILYCELVCAAQGLGRHDLAREWTDVMDTWRGGRAIGGVNGRCRVHKAELLRLGGSLAAAEQEALGACAELSPWLRREYGWPLVELGNVRLRRGDLVGAEDAFRAADDLAWSPQPVLALLRLEQGELGAARALIDDAVSRPFPLPWKERPPVGDLQLVPLLSAQAEIAFAAADEPTCRRAAERLEGIAKRYPSSSLDATAALARARHALLSDDTEQARRAAEVAVEGWSHVGAPYDTAEARIALAEAHARVGADDLAAHERAAARRAFEQVGALARVEALNARATAPPSGPAVFRREGDHRVVEFAGTAVVVSDLVGYRYIERLITAAGRELHVLDLIAADNGGRAVAQPGLPVLDDVAREAYRRRLLEIEEDIEDARASGDVRRIDLGERDRDFLLAELRRATGLGGRIRGSGSDAERARTSVTRSIKYALGRLSTQHRQLGAHLTAAVHTGLFCRYEPEGPASIEWSFAADDSSSRRAH